MIDKSRLQGLSTQIDKLAADVIGKKMLLDETGTNKLVQILRMTCLIIGNLDEERDKLIASKKVMDEKLTACMAIMTQEQRDKVFPVTGFPQKNT